MRGDDLLRADHDGASLHGELAIRRCEGGREAVELYDGLHLRRLHFQHCTAWRLDRTALDGQEPRLEPECWAAGSGAHLRLPERGLLRLLQLPGLLVPGLTGCLVQAAGSGRRAVWP